MADYLYYYGSDVEQFTFFRLPKKLIRDKQFRKLSSDAKILYGILMDRMTLSLKNNWIDDEGRVYIIYRVTEIMEEFGCSKRKSLTLMAELDEYGLIERQRQGLGKPNLIYVKNFNQLVSKEELGEKKACEAYETEAEFLEDIESEAEEEEKSNLESAEDFGIGVDSPEQKNDTLEIEGEVYPSQRCRNVHLQKCKNVHLQECKNVHLRKCRNVHHNNETEYNENNNINNLSINPVYSNNKRGDPADRWNDRELIIHTLHKKLGYDILINDMPEKKEQIRELFDLMADVCCYAGTEQKLGDNIIPTEAFRKRFLQQMNFEHVKYVIWQLSKSRTKIKNIRAYMLACLFNAPVSMNNYYQLDFQATYEG